MKQLQKNVYYEIGKKEDIKKYSRNFFHNNKWSKKYNICN